LPVFAAALAAGFVLRLVGMSTGPSGGAREREPMEVTIYLAADAGESYYLQPVSRWVVGEANPPEAAMVELIRGPDSGSGLLPVIPPGVSIRSLEVEDGVCRLDLSKEYIMNAPCIGASPALERLSLAAICNTLTEIEGIHAVVLRIEGRQKGLLEGRYVEDLWGFFGLPEILTRDESLVGPPGLGKELWASIPSWKRIDKLALADALGWGEISCVNTALKRVSLTFDAGASGLPTPAILDSLREAGVHATFFLTGQFAESYPELVKRMAEEGHELANHSYSHPRFTEIGAEEARRQITRTEDLIRRMTGLSTKPYFRFPYGARNGGLVALVNQEGYLSIFWTIDTLDWDTSTTCEQIRSRVMRNIKPGAIILMHCGSPQEAQALPLVIRDLREMGYEPTTLTELLSDGT